MMTKDAGKETINTEALFHDGTEDYRIPQECEPGDRVTLRFRTQKGDAEQVLLILVRESGDAARTMRKTSSDALFDYYEAELTVKDDRVQYYFEVEKGEKSCIYSRLGAGGKIGSRYYFTITPGFHVPRWMYGCVMYQIFTDRFCNGNPENDVRDGEFRYLNGESKKAEDWNTPIETLDVGRFYGGDLEGILQKLDYLKLLGVEAVYLNPIFVSPSNHKYDCQDYEHIDPHYTVIPKDGDYVTRTTDPENLAASDAFFAEFTKCCHEAGIRVIIDGVFNHCGSFHKVMDREKFYHRSGMYPPGAYESKESPYHGYFRFENDADEAWPDNGSYEQWWGNETLPKLNYEGSAALENEILKIAGKWVGAPYHADGWRLDVAADLGHSAEYNHLFWEKFRRAVKHVNPEAVIFAEHYGDPAPWLLGDEWDTIMNYDAFMEPVTWFLTGMEKHSDAYQPELEGNGAAFFEMMRSGQAAMQTASVLSSMNELSNHDHSRFLTRTGKQVGRLQSRGGSAAEEGINFGLFSAAVVIQMTWPGAPTIYYGDEVGLCGWTDPDNRRPFPWGRENHRLLDFHIYMVALHKHEVFRFGSWKELYAGRYLIAYGRMRGKHFALVAVNAGDCTQEIDIPVWQLGATDEMTITRVMFTDQGHYNVGKHHRAAKGGFLHCTLPPYSAKVYINWAADEYHIGWVDR